MNGKWKKNKEKKKRKEEERKKWVKDIMIMDLTCVNDKKRSLTQELRWQRMWRSQTLRKRRRKRRKEKNKIEGKGARNWLWER